MSQINSARSNSGIAPIGTQTNVRVHVPGTSIHLAAILQSTNHSSRRLGIICHGILGHKNYLFQPMLANKLAPYMDTVRFDLRGNGESDGEMGYSNWDDDQADIDAVVNHFEREGYHIYALIGHSRGAMSTMHYAAVSNHVPLIPNLISLSCRHDMADVYRKHGPELMGLLDSQGYFDWPARVNRKEVNLKVTKQDMQNFLSFDSSAVVNIPAMTNILLCHGSIDNVVPVRDVATLQRLTSHANTSTRIITDADHNYKMKFEEITDAVSDYFSAAGRKEEWARHILPNWKTWVHAVGGVLNFRTVGDIWIPSPVDGTVSYLRPGIIYRSADISKPTPEGVKVLEALNITDVFDLRSHSEIERRGFFESEKIKRHHTPVFAEVDYSPAQIALRFQMYLGGNEGFAKAYMSMMPNIRLYLTPILDHIVNKRTPFIVHCTAGKDRTGVVCAILQMICGISDEMIAWEYELTNRCMAIKEEDVNFLKMAIGGDSSEEKVRGVLSAKEEFMFRFLKDFRAKYGNIYEFMESELGMKAPQVDTIRNALLVKIPVPRALL